MIVRQIHLLISLLHTKRNEIVIQKEIKDLILTISWVLNNTIFYSVENSSTSDKEFTLKLLKLNGPDFHNSKWNGHEFVLEQVIVMRYKFIVRVTLQVINMQQR